MCVKFSLGHIIWFSPVLWISHWAFCPKWMAIRVCKHCRNRAAKLKWQDLMRAGKWCGSHSWLVLPPELEPFANQGSKCGWFLGFSLWVDQILENVWGSNSVSVSIYILYLWIYGIYIWNDPKTLNSIILWTPTPQKISMAHLLPDPSGYRRSAYLANSKFIVTGSTEVPRVFGIAIE